MKKGIFILCLIMLSGLLFAELDLELGPCIFLDLPVPLKDLDEVPAAVKHFGLEDIVIGADLEIIMGIFQFGTVASFSPPVTFSDDGMDIEHPAFITLALDGGICVSILFLRLGIGAGPTLGFPIIHERSDKPVDLGINIKGNIDFDIRGIAIRLNLSTYMDLIDMSEGNWSALPVYAGISILIDLI